MSRWRQPSLSIHGIEGAYADPGAKTVIPKKVIGKFSIRLVPNQDPKKVDNVVVEYLNKKWAERKSSNNFKVCFSKFSYILYSIVTELKEKMLIILNKLKRSKLPNQKSLASLARQTKTFLVPELG